MITESVILFLLGAVMGGCLVAWRMSCHKVIDSGQWRAEYCSSFLGGFPTFDLNRYGDPGENQAEFDTTA